jgi:hypothetical protein
VASEKPNRICLTSIFSVLEAIAIGRQNPVNERTKVQMAASIYKMQPSWRRIGEVSVLLDGTIGRQEAGAKQTAIYDRKDGESYAQSVSFEH